MLHEFNLPVPEGMPIYLQEELYERMCERYYTKGVALDVVLAEGSAEIEQFKLRFPILSIPRADAVIKEVAVREAIPDGTVIFKPDDGKYHGYFGNKVVSKAKSLDSLKQFMTTKYGVTSFEIKELETGHA